MKEVNINSQQAEFLTVVLRHRLQTISDLNGNDFYRILLFLYFCILLII